VIQPHEVMMGVLAGCALIVFGLVPGLLEGLAEGIRNFGESLSSSFSGPSHSHQEFRRPTWLAGVGAALIALTLAAYLSN
jgi:hypothetical protein